MSNKLNTPMTRVLFNPLGYHLTPLYTINFQMIGRDIQNKVIWF